MKVLTIVVVLMLCACGSTPKKNEIVGVKQGDEYYAVDHAAKEAIANEDSKEKLVCKRRQVTGTHFKSKRCTTASQAKREREETERSIERNRGALNKVLTEERKGN